MQILIDNRVGSRELAVHIDLKHSPRYTKLEYGDVAFMGYWDDNRIAHVGVERKKIRDLLGSMRTGRLYSQLTGMQRCYTHIVLLVEGVWKVDDRSGRIIVPYKRGWKQLKLGSQSFSGSEVLRYLSHQMFMLGVHVIRTADIEQTGTWINEMCAWWDKKWENHHQVQIRQDTVEKREVQLQRPPLMTRMLCQIDGVGPDKASRITKVFGDSLSVAELGRKSSEGLQVVEGIGSITADRVVDGLNKKGVR